MLVINKQELLQRITPLNIREITLQAPEGLKRKALEIAQFLEDNSYTVYISADPCYGACDLKEYGSLLVHIGHSEIYSPGIPVVFLNVYDDFDFIPVLQQNLNRIPSPVGLLTTVQHRLQLPRIVTFLEDNNVQPVLGKGTRTTFEGQILGCDLTAAVSIQDEVEAFLYLGTGVFHPLGASISTHKKVFSVYSTIEEVNPENLLRKRHALIFAASQGKTFGIVMSTKKGQSRRTEALKIRDYLKSKGKKTYLFIADEIRPEILYGCDAYVICACPRIALDDQALYEKPVLTCTEVCVMFDDVPYTMDMIL